MVSTRSGMSKIETGIAVVEKSDSVVDKRELGGRMDHVLVCFSLLNVLQDPGLSGQVDSLHEMRHELRLLLLRIIRRILVEWKSKSNSPSQGSILRCYE